jgi:hypothetical protein
VIKTSTRWSQAGRGPEAERSEDEERRAADHLVGGRVGAPAPTPRRFCADRTSDRRTSPLPDRPGARCGDVHDDIAGAMANGGVAGENREGERFQGSPASLRAPTVRLSGLDQKAARARYPKVLKKVEKLPSSTAPGMRTRTTRNPSTVPKTVGSDHSLKRSPHHGQTRRSEARVWRGF